LFASGSVEVLQDQSSSGRATAALWECQWRITRSYARQVKATPDPMDAVERFIENHLSQVPSLDAAAKAGGLSPNHANSLWKQRTGRTICAHWRLRRIETALGLLRNTDMGVKQVALQLGFNDLQQFNKLMRRLAGSNPRAVRLD
jgi:AraC-like DNA-binding protein